MPVRTLERYKILYIVTQSKYYKLEWKYLKKKQKSSATEVNGREKKYSIY